MAISKIKTNSIDTDAITSDKIAAGVISASDVADGTLTGAKLVTPLDLSATVITAPKIANGGFIADANGNEQIKFTTTASAVNELTVTNNATGSAPIISATGGDTNIGIALTPKGTGGIVLPAGAVGTPALTTSGDLDTGIFFPSADTIAFTEGGSEAMRIDSDGDVGIGTTNPTQKLQVSGNIADTNGRMFAYYILHNSSNLSSGTNTIGNIDNQSGLITIRSLGTYPHNSNILFTGRGGAGVAYDINWLDPDSGWTTSRSFSFIESGGDANTYTVAMNADSGILSVQRTSGSASYNVFVYKYFMVAV